MTSRTGRHGLGWWIQAELATDQQRFTRIFLSEAPNPKLQYPKKLQSPNYKITLDHRIPHEVHPPRAMLKGGSAAPRAMLNNLRLRRQVPTSKEIPNLNIQIISARRPGLGAWCLMFLWSLDVGIWCLSAIQYPVVAPIRPR
jgi:hypothetical protein